VITSYGIKYLTKDEKEETGFPTSTLELSTFHILQPIQAYTKTAILNLSIPRAMLNPSY
jgi:hypothetical protein